MKTTTKSAFHRGFTLIELMIVIVILGILMGTILPRLSGAQGRARDTGRVADLNQIAQGLELYYDDFGSYPSVAAAAPECLGGSTGTNITDLATLAGYFKGDEVPTTEGTVAVGGETCTGGYLYLPLTNNGAPNQAYMLVASVETETKGNFFGVDGAALGASGSATFNTSLTLDEALAEVETFAEATTRAGAGEVTPAYHMLAN